jgi:hypothetical protein
MASDLWNIVLNVVASFVYAGLVWMWKQRGARGSLPRAPSPNPLPSPSQGAAPLPQDRRARNRRALEHAAQQFLFYFITFAALYLSITMPPLFKALFAKAPPMLSDARIVGDYLPELPVGKSYLQLTFFVAAAILYWPLLLAAETATSLLFPLIDSFQEVTASLWTRLTMLWCLVFCIPVAATSMWLFNQKPFLDCLWTVFAALFLAFVFGMAQSGRR